MAATGKLIFIDHHNFMALVAVDHGNQVAWAVERRTTYACRIKFGMFFSPVSIEIGWANMFLLEEMPFFERSRIVVQLFCCGGNELFIWRIRFRGNTSVGAIAPHAIRDQIYEPIEFFLRRIRRLRRRPCARREQE